MFLACGTSYAQDLPTAAVESSLTTPSHRTIAGLHAMLTESARAQKRFEEQNAQLQEKVIRKWAVVISGLFV
jgi:hypothetical protein